jgi:GNAT superfamily N-acetyltransferase
MKKDSYILAPPTNEELWQAYHKIRREVLFEARGKYGAYDANRADEHLPQNHPFLLLYENEPVGVVRVDLPSGSKTAYFRRVAIKAAFQRAGHGRVLMERAEDFARSQGRDCFVANVALDAVPFYQKLGYELDPLHPENDPKNPRMTKRANTSWVATGVNVSSSIGA